MKSIVRDKRKNVYLSDSEESVTDDAAKSLGMPWGVWARSVLLAAAKKEAQKDA